MFEHIDKKTSAIRSPLQSAVSARAPRDALAAIPMETERTN